MSDQWEKKSERFEVRLPHTKKQAFVKACEEQGDTPSSAVRRFIDGYLRRADIDTLKMASQAFRNMLYRNWLLVGVFVAGVFAATLFGRQMVVKSTQAKIAAQKVMLFSAYDTDGDGVLRKGEIAKNDDSLHRVLNIDGIAGISLEEFRIQGKMQWALTKTETEKKTQAPLIPRNLVLFDLKDQEKPELNSWVLQETRVVSSDSFDRFVMWGRNATKPSSYMEHVAIGTNAEGKVSITMGTFTNLKKEGE